MTNTSRWLISLALSAAACSSGLAAPSSATSAAAGSTSRAVAAHDVWAMTASALLMHWNGKDWTYDASWAIGGVAGGIWGASARDAVVGYGLA